ncbi:hypothetical protein HDU67_003257 [Dinochytrium kinnereticum]|nr:hypothetical protein HDU67_003257 [Dinochytrium kinnereticum]
MSAFDKATEVSLIATEGSGKSYAGRVPDDWNIGFVPLGGISLSIAMRAVMEFFKGSHPDPVIATANFLRPSRKGEPCLIQVDIIKKGRSYSTATATMSQKLDGKEEWTPIIHVVTTWGDLSGERGPTIPMEGKCPPMASVQELKVDRLYPADVPWAGGGIGQYIKQRFADHGPSGARREQWLRFTDNREPDLLSLTMFGDAFTPTLLKLRHEYHEFASSYFPTMEISIHYRKKPKNGWLALITRSRAITNGRFESDCDIYDESGQLVAMSSMEEGDAVLYYDAQWRREDYTGWYTENSGDKPLEAFKIDELPSLSLGDESRKVVRFPLQRKGSSDRLSLKHLPAKPQEGNGSSYSPVACILVAPQSGIIRRANRAAVLLGFRIGEPFSVGERACMAVSDCLAVLTSVRDALVEADMYGPEVFPSSVTFKTESTAVLPCVRLGPAGVSADLEARVAFLREVPPTPQDELKIIKEVDNALKKVQVKLSSNEEMQTLQFKREKQARRYCLFDVHVPWGVEDDFVITITETENTTPFDRKDYSIKSFLLDSIQQAIIVTDMAFNVTYFNRWAYVLYGLLPENIGKLIPLISKVNEDVAATIMQNLSEGKSWTGTFLCRNRDGLYFPGIVGISMDNTPYEQAMKNLTALRNNLETIVQQRTAELVEANEKLEVELQQRRKLQGDLELFSLVVRKTNTMVAVLDTELQVKWANESFYRSTSYTAEDIVGKQLFDYAIEWQSYRGGMQKSLSSDRLAGDTRIDSRQDAASKLQVKISKKLKNGEQVQDDFLMMRRDGSCWFSCDATPIFSDRQLQYVIVVMHDISHKKLVEAEVAAASRMKDEFVTLVSHELRTYPFQPASKWNYGSNLGRFKSGTIIEIAKSEFKDAVDTMSIVMSSSQLLLNLVNNVLDLQKIDAGKMDFNKSPMEVSSCIVRAVRACQHIANQKDVTIIVLYAGRLLTVHAETSDDLSKLIKDSTTTPTLGAVATRSLPVKRRRSFVSRGLGSRQDSDNLSQSIVPDPTFAPHDQWYRLMQVGESTCKQFAKTSARGLSDTGRCSGSSSVEEVADNAVGVNHTSSTSARRLSMPAVHYESTSRRLPSRWMKRMYDDCGDVNLVAEALDVGRYTFGEQLSSEEDDKEFKDMPDLIVSESAKLTQCCINLIGNAIKV